MQNSKNPAFFVLYYNVINLTFILMFQFYNPNRNQRYKKDGTPMKWHGTDCTVRSLAKALNLTWIEAFRILCEEGMKMQMTFDDISVLRKVWTKHGGILCSVGKGVKPTVDEFSKEHNTGTYIVSISGHVACIKDGVLYDTFDCGAWKVRSYVKF